MAWVQPVSWHRRFALFQTQDTLKIYVDTHHQLNYANAGRTTVCEVPGEPKAPYLCGHKGFSCAIKMHNKDESDDDEGAGCLGSLVKSYIVGLLCSQAWTIPSHRAAWLIAGVAHPRSLALAPCPTAGLLWPSMPFRLH